MRGARVPDADHIARYCGGSQVKPDGTISGAAFRLRKRSGQPELYLSVNWLEHLNKSDRGAEIDEIRRVLSQKLKLGSRARIAVLNVGAMCSMSPKIAKTKGFYKCCMSLKPTILRTAAFTT